MMLSDALPFWRDTMLATAALIALVLLVRRPVARHFGARIAYALWLIPALRLVLPPLPFGAPAVVSADPAALLIVAAPAGSVTAPVAPAAGPDLLTILFLIWLGGAVLLLAGALLLHRRQARALLSGATALDPIGGVRLSIAGLPNGPVALGLWHRRIIVPSDFFARFDAEERALALDHELAHHRGGDLWANAAALVLLAAQWFNPLAWMAMRAFRCDQESACDARILAQRSDPDQLWRYGAALAKAAIRPQPMLAAPMASSHFLQERLTMLTRTQPNRARRLVGRALVAVSTLATLATTASIIPAAATQPADPVPVVPAAPPASAAEPRPAVREQRIMIFTSDDAKAADDAESPAPVERRHVIIHHGDGASSGTASTDAPVDATAIAIAAAPSRAEILAALAEQGITGSKAEAVADRLAARQPRVVERHVITAPVPADWSDGAEPRARARMTCPEGTEATTLLNERDADGEGAKRTSVMISCMKPGDRAARLAALRKVRTMMADRPANSGMTEDMRAKVTADLDKAISELEKQGS